MAAVNVLEPRRARSPTATTELRECGELQAYDLYHYSQDM